MEKTGWEAQRWLSVHWEAENLETAQPASPGCLSRTNLAWKAWNTHGESMFEGQGIWVPMTAKDSGNKIA